MNEQQLIEKTKEIMKDLNSRLFDNQLNLNFEVKISRSGKAAASVMCNGIGYKHNRIYFMKYLSVSKFFNWTEKELVDTIAHELVHVYEVQVLKRKPSHSASFLNKMYEINNKFPDISITVTHKMQSTKPKLKKNKTILFLLNQEKNKIIFLSSKKSLPSDSTLKANFGDYSIGEICSSKANGYKVVRKIRYSYKVTLQKLNELGIEF